MFEGKEVDVILSQAGAGKTHKLMSIVAEELKVRRPEEIAFVTFTRKGAEEGLRRVCNNFNYDPDDLPYFRTLHSLTFHALGLKQTQMFNHAHERKFNKEYGYSLNRSAVSAGMAHSTRDSQYLDYYDLERSGALTSTMVVEADIEIGYYRQLVRKYEEYKSANALVDFFDCLLKYKQAGDSLPVQVALIDEAQDITALQWAVIEKAFSKAKKIYIAGDENQSIFTYSGARPDFLINFAKQYPVEHLASSYRIPRKVYELSKGIVDFISDKTDKPFDFHEGNAEGQIVQISHIERMKHFITEPKENDRCAQWYFLARNKCFLPRITQLLEELTIPYWTCDGFFMGGQIIQRLSDYEGFRLQGYKSEEKKLQFMKKFMIENFDKPFTETCLFTEDRKWVYASYVEKYGMEKLKEMCKWTPQILVSTIHFVKGGEADNVCLLLDNTRRTVGTVFKNIDEELRVLYVGVTRTKQNLFLVDSLGNDGYDKIIRAIKDQNGLDW